MFGADSNEIRAGGAVIKAFQTHVFAVVFHTHTISTIFGNSSFSACHMTSNVPSVQPISAGCPMNSLLTPMGYVPDKKWLCSGNFSPDRVTP